MSSATSASWQCGAWEGGAGSRAGRADGPPPSLDAATGRLSTGAGCAAFSVPSALGWPASASFFSRAELVFDGIPPVEFAARRWADGSVAALVAGYLLCVALAPRLGAAWGLPTLRGRRALLAWNAALALFSLSGAGRTMPHLALLVYERGLEGSVCSPAEPTFGTGPAGLWVSAFCFSKLPELGDTAFLLARGKRVTFLHWFHHATVLLFTWHAYATRASVGLYYASANYFVHALMYAFYALDAAGARPRWGPAVTALQLAQMFLGMAVTGVALAARRAGRPCDTTLESLAAAGAMYFAYACLFAQFARDRYCAGAREKKLE